MKRILFFLLVITLLVQQLTILPGCANIVPPSGGPRDSLPPVLETASPADSSRNVSGTKITLNFDEFVELQNAQQALIISPLPKNFPDVSYKLKTVTVKLRDSLEANTTYSLQFGEAIRDFTEGNVLKNFSYTFSTGAYIDSLELKGRVVLAENGKTDTTLLVMLHSSGDDSAVVKEKPRYITRLDGKGNFVFRNLPAKTYYLYALKDDGGTRRYMNDKQLFAFADSAQLISGKNEPVTLYAYSSAPAPSSTTALANLSVGRNKRPASGDSRLKYQTNLSNGQHDLLKDFVMNFEEALKSFDSSKIRLYTDSVFNPVMGYRYQKDSLAKSITLLNTWKENTDYHLILDREFAEDSAGRKLLKTDTLSFRTRKLSEYGALKIRFKNLDLKQNPVLLFYNADNLYKSIPLTGNEISQSLFTPGEYELRLLGDKNKNGKWDPGDFFKKRLQPEIVKPLEKKITVKPGAPNEVDVTL